ncbi:AAA family ATPase [uncultured Dokdonia sp.]|uniref:AAA family ATPase n=1 Tax=uncultured Dokdonia sp. TaxID=575653 RepID=UPI00262CD905|nr:AAA family ATPase [uncultured Dokdonia sp.]
MSILIDIINWVEDKPQFWQEAINRIISNKNLTEKDIIDLTEICKAEQGDLGFDFEKVNIQHLKELVQSSITQGDIRLSKIFNNENINALQDNTELAFAEKGLTTIYGDNGSGKSSYVSILKNTCNTRGKKPQINFNLFNADSGSKRQIAQVEYLKEDDSKSIVTWQDNSLDSGILKTIDVFDSYSANHYIEGEDEIAFIPSGLAVLEKLAKCCNQIEAIINYEISTSRALAYNYSFLLDEYETEVSKFLRGLNAKTELADLNKISNHTDVSEKRIEELSKIITELKATNPEKETKENSKKIQRFIALKSKYSILEDAFSEKILNATITAINSYISLAEASKTVSQKAFSNLSIDGVGNDHWKRLWESARKFYDYGYGEDSFPNIEEETNCPLCLQVLGEEAKIRFQNFEEFVKADIQGQLDQATEKINNAKKHFKDLNFDFTENQPTIDELEELSANFNGIQKEYLYAFQEKQNEILSYFENLKSLESINVLIFGITPITIIDGIIDSLEKRNKTLEETSIDKELKKYEEEYVNLVAIKNLQKYKEQVWREIERMKLIVSLNKCTNQCNTRGITLFSNLITKNYITDALKDNFKDELKKLGFKNISVNTATKGVRGRQFHYLELDTSYGVSVSLKEILSEGEHRCISLATFLSELSISEHKSAIIFDDPVSSLDHKWRNKIAKRVAEESKERQVIVFTHDITFLIMLEEHTSKLSCDFNIKSLTRKKSETGIPALNPPWDALKVSSRVGILKNIHQQLKKIELNETEDIYKEEVKSFYGKLRETWERLIEEVLLNQAVQRFSRAIQTQRLKKVVDMTDDDYKMIEENMSKCSTYFQGHDSAGALIEGYPDADEVNTDIEILDTYLRALRKRRG